jgi:hypothetical protein
MQAMPLFILVVAMTRHSHRRPRKASVAAGSGVINGYGHFGFS